jgi:Core-2/I-Branching enzyme
VSERIGFIILSHMNPPQLLRLVRTLRRLYDNPPIVCHHDFSQSPLIIDEFPSGVRFVLPHLKTRWGQFSLVAAALRALDFLYRDVAPNWFVLMSGADYPTMRPEKVLKELTSSQMDAFLDYRDVVNFSSDSSYPAIGNSALEQHFSSLGNLAVAWRRYVGLNLWFPIIRNGPRIGRYTVYLPFKAWSSPFRSQFKCFYGDFWFAGNQKVAEMLLKPTDKHMQLRRYLRWRVVPEECYFQTVLGNTSHLKIGKETRRFAKWEGGPGAHPWTLGLSDLPAIISAGAYFARKFAPESPVLDEIDRMLSS